MAQKIDSIFDLSAVEAEIKKIAASMSAQFGAATNISTLGASNTTKGGGNTSGGATAGFNAMNEAAKRLTKSIQELQIQQQAVNAEMQKNNVTRSQNNQQAKLNAILTNQYTTALQKLDAQIKLNVIDAQKYVAAGDTQNRNYLELMKNTKKLSSEYDRMSKASGSNMVKTNSMYGATFQLTQVMRELPNFAIDARIGFMALSNNLPMLADSFTQLSKEIDVTTGKIYGFSGAAKQFAKSLLSMNTIMIVASTLLILFGDDIMDFIVNLKSAETAADKFYKTVKEGYDGIYKKMADDVSTLLKFSLDYYAARKSGDKELIKELEDRGAKEYDLHRKQFDMIAENVNWWRDAFKEYLDMAQITYQNEFRIKAGVEAEFNIKRERANQKMIEQRVREAAIQSGVNAEGAESEVKRLREGRMGKLELTYWKETKDWTESIKKETEAIEQLKVLKQISVTAIKPKSQIEPKKPSGGKQTMQDGSDFDTKRYIYDEDAFELKKRAAELESEIESKLTDETIVFYENRVKAITEYYEIKAELINRDMNNEADVINESQKNAMNELTEKKEKNEKLFNEGKMTKQRYQELMELYNNAVIVLGENTEEKLFEVSDKYLLQLEQNALKSGELIVKYFEQVQGQMPIPEGGIKTPTVGINIKGGGVAPATPKSVVDRGGKGVGKITPEMFNDEVAKNTQNYANGIISYKTYLSKKNELLEASDIQAIDITEKNTGDMVAVESERQQRIIDIYSQGLDIIAEAVQGFYDRYFEMLEKEKDKQAKIQDEKLLDVEDREKAGVLSKEDAEKEKARINAYYQSIDEEIERKKLEKEKEAFIIEQAFKLGQVWINFAAASASLENMLVGGAFTPLYLTQALLSSAMIAAQTIPAFAEGGDMLNDGKAWLGDGGKHELAISPDGKMFISGNTPSLYELEKGTHIFPDVNKVDLNSLLALKQVNLGNVAQKDDRLMRELISTVKGQKQATFYGMPLMRQMTMSDRYSRRKSGLMN